MRAERNGRFHAGTVTIDYSPEHLGWVDPETLRVFRVDPEARTWHLVPDSGPDGRGTVRARIDRPGLYGVVGLPAHPAVLETIRRACALPNAAFPERGAIALLPICRLIMCAPELGRWTEASSFPLEPPGGFGGTVCDLCLGLRPPANGLPECQLLEPPEPEPGSDVEKDVRAYAVTAMGWIGVIVPWGGGGTVPAWIEVFDLDFPMRLTDSYAIGQRWCTSLAISSTGDRVFVADVSLPGIAAYDGSGTLSGTATLPASPTGPVVDCALSPDGATLYVAAPSGLVAIDAATVQVSTVVPTSDPLAAVSVSPDGATVAAAGPGALYAFDAATLTPQRVQLPTSTWWMWPDVVLVSANRAVTGVGALGSLQDVDLTTGTATALPIPPQSPTAINTRLLFAPQADKVYVLSGVLSLYPGVQPYTDIFAIDISTRTWSTRQFPKLFTAGALMPDERILLTDYQLGASGDSLAVYDPGTGAVQYSTIQTPYNQIRDLKVIAT